MVENGRSTCICAKKSYKGRMHFWKSMQENGARIVGITLLVVAFVVQAASAQTPEDEELTIWLPEGARIEQRLLLPHNIVTTVIAPEPPEEVLDFYEQRIEEEGWTLISTFEQGGVYTVFALRGRRDATLTISPDGRGGSRIRASVSRTEWHRLEPLDLP